MPKFEPEEGRYWTLIWASLGKCTCDDGSCRNGGVNRGCHDPPYGMGAVDGALERASNFDKVLSTLTS